MSIKGDFFGYFDLNGLCSPEPCPPGTIKASDNGTCYTSEYYIMLQKSGQLADQDKLEYAQKIGSCIDSNGLLNRVPVPQSDGQEGPDNYYGVLNGCKQLQNVYIPRKFLKAVFKYFGALNNVNPGTWTSQSFLIRQPQLLACMVASAFPSFKNPLHVIIRMLCLPLFLISSVIIAVSCMFQDTSNTDSRRLGWHLWQNLKGVSLSCWIAGRIWRRRLYKEYTNDMRDVAGVYYKPSPVNPYSKNWITD